MNPSEFKSHVDRTLAESLSQPVHAFGKVAVLLGGRSAEREVSLKSGGGVLAALQALGVDAHGFDPAQQDLGLLKAQGFARCFIALHGRYGEDGTVQGALELLGLPYTGSGVLASSLAMDKSMTKRVWQSAGLPTPASYTVQSAGEAQDAFHSLQRLGATAAVVKPAREGSSIGLTKVSQPQDVAKAYALSAQNDTQVLVEQFISGDEVTVPVLQAHSADKRADNRADKPQAVVMPIIKIEAPGGNYDYENKYHKNDTRYLIPSGLPTAEETAIAEHVRAAFSVLGCRGWARADVMIDRTSRKPYLLEINTSPGMTDHSLVPKSAASLGIAYPQLCAYLLSMARLEHV